MGRRCAAAPAGSSAAEFPGERRGKGVWREARPRRGGSPPAFPSRWISQPFSARVGGGTPGSLGRSPLSSRGGEAPGPCLAFVCG